MRNQYQIQQYNPLATQSVLFSTFQSLDTVRKTNTVGSAQLVVPGAKLLGVGYEVLENISYTIDWTGYKNSIIVGGSGNGEDRLIVTVSDQLATSQSKWGLVEAFEASRDSADVDALAEVGRNFLGSKREVVTFQGDLQDLPGSEYGVNYFFGDVLSFSQPNFEAVFNTPFIIQQLNDIQIGVFNDTIYFLKKLTVDNNALLTTLVLHDALSLLDQRIVGYALGTSQTSKEGPADDVIKEIIRENCLVSGREVDNLSIDSDFGLAPVVKVDDIAWRSVLGVCQEIAQMSYEKGTPLFFDIVADVNLNLRFKTFIDQRGNNRATTVGITSPYRAMIDSVKTTISGGREDRQIVMARLNGDELVSKSNDIVVSSNEATITSRAGRSGGVDPFEFYLIDDNGDLLIDDNGEFLVDDNG